MRSVRADNTKSSKGLRVQHPTGQSPRLQSVAPTESPYQRGGCYSSHVTDTLLTFFPLRGLLNPAVGLSPSPLALSGRGFTLPKQGHPRLVALQGVNPTEPRQNSEESSQPP